MNTIYSKNTYQNLVSLHTGYPILFFIVLLIISPIYFLFFQSTLSVLIVVTALLLPIVTIALQYKNVLFGYLIFINLAFEWYFFSNYMQGTVFLIVIPYLIIIYSHFYIASTLFTLTSNRRLKTACLATFLFIILLVLSQFNYLRGPEWRIYRGGWFQIQYSPTYKINEHGNRFIFPIKNSESIGSLGVYYSESHSQTVEKWLRDEWPNTLSLIDTSVWNSVDLYESILGKDGRNIYFYEKLVNDNKIESNKNWANYFNDKMKDVYNRTKKIKIDGSEGVKLPPISTVSGKFFNVFLPKGDDVIVQVQCFYVNDTAKRICDKMISSLKINNLPKPVSQPTI